jgi:hypothetical protein
VTSHSFTRSWLPDAFALATAIHAEHRGFENVEMTSFDAAVLKAYGELRESACSQHASPRATATKCQ